MNSAADNAGHTLRIQHWVYWGLNLVCAIGAGVFLLPFLRSHPASIHEFVLGLADWQRILFVFVLCVVFASTMFKLFSPRLCHLKHFRSHPPTWLAWLVACIVLATIDLAVGLSPNRYTASFGEWIGYGLGALLLVALYPEFIASTGSSENTPESGQHSRQNLKGGDWEAVEAWLQSDAPAEHDFLGNRAVAQRLKSMLDAGTRSIGIVGRFGAGKTSIVKWIVGLVSDDAGNRKGLLLSEHSCWGFENSASCVHAMLADAIAKVERRIDTFQVRSLPESYRQTFSAGGEWLDNVSKLLFGTRDPMEQFRRLSALLADMNTRLVFVVENLDRNKSRSFDIQEVLAFLHQLKEFPNLSFVLTGGLNAPARIDFAKLCDHIEHLRAVSVQQSASFVETVRGRCLNQEAFAHVVLADRDDKQWSQIQWMLLIYREEVSPPEAVARLLTTPRALRHVLRRTYEGWKRLCGEIDWDHLLAVNVLRFAAPEAFSFVLTHWHRFNDDPPNHSQQGSRVLKVRDSLRREWDAACSDAEWDGRAARALIDLILPATPMWLDDDGYGEQRRLQGLHRERYWQRALNESIAPDEVCDQVVIRDIRNWIDLPRGDSELITGICSAAAYSDVWEDFAGRFFADKPDLILLICEQVLARISSEHGSAASSDCQGFGATWRLAEKRVSVRAENRAWLEARIAEAAEVSIELVNSLWHYYGASGRYSLLRPEDVEPVREYEIRTLREQIVDGQALGRLVDPRYPYVLYQLVFDPGDHNPTSVGDVPVWTWMAPALLDALRRGNTTLAVAVASLVAARESGGPRTPLAVDPDMLIGFFSDDAAEVVGLLGQLADRVGESDQRQLVSAIVESARNALAERN